MNNRYHGHFHNQFQTGHLRLLPEIGSTCLTPPINGFDIKYIQQMIFKKGPAFSGFFNQNFINSAFQPIFSPAHKRIVGYESLVRAKDSEGRPVSPAELFSPQKQESYHVLLDRLCRYVHILNFFSFEDDTNWLFLNVSPEVINNGKHYGSYFGDLLNETGFPPHRTVIEIVEHPVSNRERLVETVNYYKNLGCLIAIDDFGACYSNFDRIWDLSPDIVKLDRSIILGASQEKKIRRLLPGIVSLIHQAGALVLVEGIETQEQAMIVMDTDTDFVQGFFFSKPASVPALAAMPFPEFDKLYEKYKHITSIQGRRTRAAYAGYNKMFSTAIGRLLETGSLKDACADLLKHESVVRCFLLHPEGIQIGQTVLSDHCLQNRNEKFKPIREASNADWFRRHYLRRAIIHPGQIQITRPYLSITGAHMCVTLSKLFPTPDGDRVLCCDLICE